MAIASEGGNGSSTISVAGETYTSKTIFTTPSSTDYIYKVTLSAVSSSNNTSVAFVGSELASADGNSGSAESITSPCGLGTVTVGPNTGVEVAVNNNSPSPQDITFAYIYVGVKIS
jgi:hypothetical protein